MGVIAMPNESIGHCLMELIISIYIKAINHLIYNVFASGFIFYNIEVR